jgi:hypothetical protein
VTVEKPKSSQTASSSPVYFFALLVALVLTGLGFYYAMHDRGVALLAAGVVSLVAVLVTWPLAAALASARRATEAERSAITSMLADRLQQIGTLLTMISEQQLLSDRAKSVAFREKDREALRRAIREEMAAKDWDAALVLANEMATQFGYTQEAAVLKVEINNNRTEVMRKQITDSFSLIDQHTRAERWSQALREAEQLMQIYPNDEQVKHLPQEIENRRQAHKRQLNESFREAVARNDVDGSIEILKRLDNYLTPVEAEAMQETVRKLFKEKLNNLKNQFSQAVHEEHWTEAIRIGETISRDFPNSRIALEVRDMLDTLRQRASRQEVAKA